MIFFLILHVNSVGIALFHIHDRATGAFSSDFVSAHDDEAELSLVHAQM